MLIDSFEHAEADFEARLLIDARNEAESVVNATEKSLRRPDFEQLAGSELTPGERARIDAALARLKDVIGSSDRALIHERTHELNHATQHLAEVMMNRSVREALAGRNVKDV
jgi:molecular chaperone DnaK/molecular chaperone HscA